jgi:hypothetical protein
LLGLLDLVAAVSVDGFDVDLGQPPGCEVGEQVVVKRPLVVFVGAFGDLAPAVA